MTYIDANSDLSQQMTVWRRLIHAHPETAFEEILTSNKIKELLSTFGLAVHTDIAKTGVVGLLRGNLGDSDEMIGLRADIDALDITEKSNLDYRSKIKGKMHACGHDGHTAMLLGAAKYLSENRNFNGCVAFIFQPAEERFGGGRVMCEEGLFSRFPCRSVYGMHNWPGLAEGEFAVHCNEVMAAAEFFDITLTGKGGHAAMPHLSADPMPAAMQLINALQTIISRTLNPFETGVISVTKIEAGQAYNIIADKVTLSGTIRSFSDDVHKMLREEICRKLDGIRKAYSMQGSIEFLNYYPATINNEECAEHCAKSIAKIVDKKNLHRDLLPSMGAEDFSYMLREKPGAYVWIGNGKSHGLHHPEYDFNDRILSLGANYWIQLVYDLLS